uniref:Uncharacterized protein n=1 Tax=Timema bartmani TaxID=61472 RepID=A0A7R9I0T9_9NEOP|nr:unnamed protein product [Timema bartmani]
MAAIQNGYNSVVSREPSSISIEMAVIALIGWRKRKTDGVDIASERGDPRGRENKRKEANNALGGTKVKLWEIIDSANNLYFKETGTARIKPVTIFFVGGAIIRVKLKTLAPLLVPIGIFSGTCVCETSRRVGPVDRQLHLLGGTLSAPNQYRTQISPSLVDTFMARVTLYNALPLKREVTLLRCCRTHRELRLGGIARKPDSCNDTLIRVQVVTLYGCAEGLNQSVLRSPLADGEARRLWNVELKEKECLELCSHLLVGQELNEKYCLELSSHALELKEKDCLELCISALVGQELNEKYCLELSSHALELKEKDCLELCISALVGQELNEKYCLELSSHALELKEKDCLELCISALVGQELNEKYCLELSSHALELKEKDCLELCISALVGQELNEKYCLELSSHALELKEKDCLELCISALVGQELTGVASGRVSRAVQTCSSWTNEVVRFLFYEKTECREAT